MPNFFFGLGTYLSDKTATMVNREIKLDPLALRPSIQLFHWTERNTAGRTHSPGQISIILGVACLIMILKLLLKLQAPTSIY